MDEEIIRKKCRNCGREIFLIQARGGRRIPVDPELIPFWWSPMGSEIFVNQDGDTVMGERSGRPENVTDVGYVPHWKTCPHEARFRRR